MASSPRSSPSTTPRPINAYSRRRSSSRMSLASKQDGSTSRSSSDDMGRTAVKVAVRVRPPLKPTDPGFDLIPQRFRGSTCQVLSPTTLAIEGLHGKKVFVFDRVLGEDVDQQGIWEFLRESVSAFIQGYNVSILAYGQSGAGKSYTMGTTGPWEQADSEMMGVIPRAAKELFSKLHGEPAGRRTVSQSSLRTPTRYSNHSQTTVPTTSNLCKVEDSNWQLTATYVEIYNEQLRDLLLADSTLPSERNVISIREDTKGRILLTGLTQVQVKSVDDLLNALNFGSSIRQTDATTVNSKSSRSHAVFTLNLIQKRSKGMPINGQDRRSSMPLEGVAGMDNMITVNSKLHFVDLAGSERMKNTGASGERAREGISINAGLASLGKVISQLSSRQPGSHVSYRDSRLTRLLQDSLGGSAITYMIACVTPAEFHLSETLNTVQYAQRARAIQSKPQIQQSADDGDKQVAIDRLRAEVAFLRDQIRLSERADRGTSGAPQERLERQHERELELQNQLLGIQENYSALSQRHAKLISEITKARDDGSSETPVLSNTIGESAVERLKRSNSFAEAVEQVVLEYEKTIESLETSLSNTRSSLSTTESSLLEKESKLAYMETITHQLQARIQKAADREQNNESYVRQLEARIDGVPGGGEDRDSMIEELRTELTRVRENEASAEEYISTLEERLAEAEQDAEIRKRDIERLESVVDRQRNIGKLDNLLLDLDNIQGADSAYNDTVPNREGSKRTSAGSHRQAVPDAGVTMVNGHSSDPQPEGDDETQSRSRDSQRDSDLKSGTYEENHSKASPIVLKQDSASRSTVGATIHEVTPSAAQSNFITDKFEAMTEELFELRVEHESTVTDYEALSQKYQVALQTLAKLQDAVNEAASPSRTVSDKSSRPTSFLANARMKISGVGQQSFSRSLSSELSSLGVSPNDLESSGQEGLAKKFDPKQTERESVSTTTALAAQETDLVKGLHTDNGHELDELKSNYAELQERHLSLLDHVDELKSEVQKAQQRPTTPSPMIRRKLSQVMASDRANRSFTALRNIATENLEGLPDARQSFEINLNAAATEMQMRSDRVAELETENAAIRKEMDTKSTIISGLTRERSSMKASPTMDVSVVTTMQEKILETETEIRALHELYAAREQELLAEIEGLKASKGSEDGGPESSLWHRGFKEPSPMPGIFPEDLSPSSDDSSQLHVEQTGNEEEYERRIDELQQKLSDVEGAHQAAMDAMQASQRQLQTTLSELQTAAAQNETSSKFVDAKSMKGSDIDWAQHRGTHQNVVENLRKEIEEFKVAVFMQASKLTELELSQVSPFQNSEDDQSRYLSAEEMQAQVLEHTFDVANLQQDLDVLYQSHTDMLEGILSALSGAQVETDTHPAKFPTKTVSVSSLRQELQSMGHLHGKGPEEFHSRHAIVQTETDSPVGGPSMQPDLESVRESHALELQKLRDSFSAAQVESEKRIAELSTQHQEALNAQDVESQAAQGKLTELVTQHSEAIASLRKELAAAHGKLTEMTAEHEEAMKSLENDLTTAQDELIALLAAAATALNEETDLDSLPQQIKFLVDEHSSMFNERSEAADQLREAQEELEVVKHRAVNLHRKVTDLTNLNEETANELERVLLKEQKSSRLVQELEDQLHSNFDQHQDTTRRLSTLQFERHARLQEVTQAKVDVQKELEQTRAQVSQLEQQLAEASKRGARVSQQSSSEPRDTASDRPPSTASNARKEPRDTASDRPSSTASHLRKSVSNTSLPSPPPAFPLPPLPNSGSGPPSVPITPISPAHQQQPPVSPPNSAHQSKELAHTQLIDELEARIRTIEKHLFAEKQLTTTLEEALTDLEASNSRTKTEADAWRKKVASLEEELRRTANEHKRDSERYSLQAVEEERERRLRAEEARKVLEERMKGLEGRGGRGKKKNALICF